MIMLGTNDTKQRLGASEFAIAKGMERVVKKAMVTDCWAPGAKPNVLFIAPPPIGRGVVNTYVAPEMGAGSVEKSEKLAAYYEQSAKLLGVHFLDANGCEFNTVDFMHLTRKGHRQLADRLSALVPTLV